MKELMDSENTQDRLVQNIRDQAFTFGLRKSKAFTETQSKIERANRISQFERRGYYRKLVDPKSL